MSEKDEWDNLLRQELDKFFKKRFTDIKWKCLTWKHQNVFLNKNILPYLIESLFIVIVYF